MAIASKEAAVLCRTEGFADIKQSGRAQQECLGRRLELAGCIVPLDAIGCQKTIAAWVHRHPAPSSFFRFARTALHRI